MPLDTHDDPYSCPECIDPTYGGPRSMELCGSGLVKTMMCPECGRTPRRTT